MNPQRNRRKPDAWVITTSFVFYRFLLIICPPTFRREYGDEMATLFRDCCREAWTHGGALALLGVWGRALSDLAATAASERMREGVQMSGPIFIKAAGLAGLIAGAWYTFLYVALIASTAPTNFNIYLGTFAAAWTSSAVLAATVPATWVLFLLGLVGLHIYLAQHAASYRSLIWCAALVTCAGVVMLFVGGPLILQPVLTSVPTADYLSFYLRGGYYIWGSFAALGIGLLGTGWSALRIQVLGRLKWIPFVAGVLAVFNVVVVRAVPIQALVAIHMPYAGLSYLVVQLAFYMVWSVGWIFIGHRLWSSPVAPESQEMTLSTAN